MTNTKFNNAREFLNEVYSDLTNTSASELTVSDLNTLIEQFDEFDLGSCQLEQLKVFVNNESLFGKTDINGEVKKIVGKALQLVNTPNIDVKKQMFLAVCQDAYDNDTKNFKSLHAQLKCLDPYGSKGLLSAFLELIPWAEEIQKEVKKLF